MRHTVIVAAHILAQAALEKFPYVSWLPSTTTAQRGGPCEATVVFSNTSISAPLVWRPQAVIIVEANQFPIFINRILPGGIIITESAGLERRLGRDDIRIYEIPAMEIALKISGDTQAANMVLLGAYVQATKALPPEPIERQIEKRFIGRKEILVRNIEAFREGLKNK